MGFLSGLFSDKKTTKSDSSQTGEQSYGLTPDVKKYWDTIAPTFQQGWNPVGNNQYQDQAAAAQAGYASGLNPAFAGAVGIGQTGIDPNDIGRFQNQWDDQVIRNATDDMRYADSQALTQSNASAAKMGALGGSGGTVRRNLAEEGFADSRNKMIAGMRQQGFNTAADLAGKSTQARLAGYGAASGIAGQQAGINQGQFGMGSQLWNQGWQNAQMPFQIAGQGAQTLGGLAGFSGNNTAGTSAGTQTTTGSSSPFSIFSNLAGLGISAYGAGMFSDERIKENIVEVGESHDGQPIYKYNYKGDPRTVIGLIAQDVEQRDPEAVGEVDGIKTVNYDRALKGAERHEEPEPMSGGGAVGEPRGEKDPHAKFKSAFDAITGLMQKARGGSVSGMTPAHAAGGPVGSWSTTVTPASSSSFDMKKLGQGLSDMGKSSGSTGSDDTSLLQQQQQSLSSMLSGMSHRARGGEVWDETGPEFGESSGMAPPMRLGAAPEPVSRRELHPARPVPADESALLSAIKGFEGYNPRAYGDYKQHSVGYGTRARHPGEVIDKGEAERRLADEVARARGIVDKFAPNLDLGTRAALTSLTYNAGDDWTRAGLGSAIRSGDMDDARRRFVQYNKAGGETLPGLVKRREAESAWIGGGSPSGDGAAPVRTAWAEPTSAEGRPIATDAPKRGGWFSEGIWAGEKMTPMQRLGVGLMSVRGPMFGGPLNDMAKQLMGMEEGRLREKQVDNQADQFAKQIAQQAEIARGMAGGQPTLAGRELSSNEALRTAQIEKLQAEAKKLAAQENDPISGFIAERLKALTAPPASVPAPSAEPKDPLLHKQSFEGGEGPRAESAVASGDGDANLVRTQAVVGDGPVASRSVEIPGTTMIDTPLGKMKLNDARQLGGAMLVSPKHQALGRSMMDAIERTEKTMTKDASASNLSQSAMSDVNKKEVAASEGLSRLAEIDRLYDPKYQTWEEGLKNAGLAAWDSIGLFRDKMTDDQRKSLTEFTKFKTTAVAALNDYVREITGAAMSQGEAERIRKGVIDSERDSPTQFKAKLDQGMRLAQLALIRHSYTRKSGKPWSESGISLDQMERIVENRTKAFREEIRKSRPNAKANEINSEVGAKLKQEFGI